MGNISCSPSGCMLISYLSKQVSLPMHNTCKLGDECQLTHTVVTLVYTLLHGLKRPKHIRPSAIQKIAEHLPAACTWGQNQTNVVTWVGAAAVHAYQDMFVQVMASSLPHRVTPAQLLTLLPCNITDIVSGVKPTFPLNCTSTDYSSTDFLLILYQVSSLHFLLVALWHMTLIKQIAGSRRV